MTYRERTIIYNGVPHPSWKWLVITILASLVIHLISYFNVSYFMELSQQEQLKDQLKKPLNIKIVSKSQVPQKRLVDVKQEKTERPKNTRFQSHQNHIAKKETKLRKQISSINNLDAGDGGRAQKTRPAQQVAKLPPKPLEQTVKKPLIGVGAGFKKTQESAYSKLLPRGADLMASRKAGYQDYIEDEIDIGDKIDLNTSQYRYMGYFTGLRKGWSQTWVYPSEAVRRGLQGKVKVEFTIEKGGELKRVKVVETSGHEVLDNAVLEALELSSPYAPLPDGFGKDRITVVYSFVYRLRGYGAY